MLYFMDAAYVDQIDYLPSLLLNFLSTFFYTISQGPSPAASKAEPNLRTIFSLGCIVFDAIPCRQIKSRPVLFL